MSVKNIVNAIGVALSAVAAAAAVLFLGGLMLALYLGPFAIVAWAIVKAAEALA